MKRILVASLIAACSMVSQAAPPTPESIEQLLSLIQADKIMEGVKPQLMAGMKASMDQALKNHKPSPEEQKVIDAYVARSANIITESVTGQSLRPLYVQLYTQHFTQEEVDAILTFYQSPAGKSMMNKMPQIMQSIMAAMPSLMAPVMEKLKASTDQMIQELGALPKKTPKVP